MVAEAGITTALLAVMEEVAAAQPMATALVVVPAAKVIRDRPTTIRGQVVAVADQARQVKITRADWAPAVQSQVVV